MRSGGYNVGGEQSGHIILSDFSTTGDGLMAALQVLAVIAEEGSQRKRGRPSLRTAAASAAQCPLQERRAAQRQARDRLHQGGRTRLNGAGRLLVRKSGTEPVIRIMAESDDAVLVQQVVRDVAAAIEEAAR